MRARAVSVSVNVSDPEHAFSDPDNKCVWPEKNESRGGSRELGRKGGRRASRACAELEQFCTPVDGYPDTLKPQPCKVLEEMLFLFPAETEVFTLTQASRHIVT